MQHELILWIGGVEDKRTDMERRGKVFEIKRGRGGHTGCEKLLEGILRTISNYAKVLVFCAQRHEEIDVLVWQRLTEMSTEEENAA